MWAEHRFASNDLVTAANDDELMARWVRTLSWRGPRGALAWEDVASAPWASIALSGSTPVADRAGAPFDQHRLLLTPFSLDPERPFAAHIEVSPRFTPAELARALEERDYRRDSPEDGGMVYGATRRIRDFYIRLSHEGRPVRLRDSGAPIAVVECSVRQADELRSWTEVPSALKLAVMTDLAKLC
jgi:hypothetical protein